MVHSLGLSIVIPTVNEYENLSKLLPFLRKNAPTEHLEIIVCDASNATQNIEDLCDRSDAVYQNCPQRRRSSQLHTGALRASHNNLLFIHADVIPPTDFYELVINLLNKENTCGSFSYRFDSKSKFLAFNASTTKSIGIFTGGGDQGLAITRKDYESLGGYDTSVSFMEDYDFYDRIKASNLTFKIMDGECTVSARKYEKNSYVKVNLSHFVIFSGYRLGVNDSKLAKLYKMLLN